MLKIRETAHNLKRSMLSNNHARGELLSLYCCLLMIFFSPFLLFHAIHSEQWIQVSIFTALLVVSSIFLMWYKFNPRFRVLPYFCATLYSVIWLNYLVNAEPLYSALPWLFIMPMLAISILGLALGTVTFGLLLLLTGVIALKLESGLLASPIIGLQNCVAALASLFFLSILVEYCSNYAFRQTRALNERLKQQALHDELTGLPNRRAIRDLLSREMARSQRNKRPLCLIMIDIDYFKKINDSFGHDVGDEALKWLAETLISLLRTSDTASRWGGEEFLVLLPETNLSQGILIAERIREKVDLETLSKNSQQVHFTVSCGLTCSESCNLELCTDIDLLVSLADEHLYQAKHNGRNRVEPQLSAVLTANVPLPEHR